MLDPSGFKQLSTSFFILVNSDICETVNFPGIAFKRSEKKSRIFWATTKLILSERTVIDLFHRLLVADTLYSHIDELKQQTKLTAFYSSLQALTPTCLRTFGVKHPVRSWNAPIGPSSTGHLHVFQSLEATQAAEQVENKESRTMTSNMPEDRNYGIKSCFVEKELSLVKKREDLGIKWSTRTGQCDNLYGLIFFNSLNFFLCVICDSRKI